METLIELPAAIPPHPAKFSRELYPVFLRMLKGCARLLDPFGGLGGIFKLRLFLPGCDIDAVEIEPEWAAAHPKTTVGNALALPWPDVYFDAICTSPCYGNRMCDHHEAKDDSIRHTYRHYYGRPLHPDNAGTLEWGDAYRDFHERAWAEAARVLQPRGRFVLNVKDFYELGELKLVTDWHIETLTRLGFALEEHRQVKTRGQRHGANGNLRAEYESVILFEEERTMSRLIEHETRDVLSHLWRGGTWAYYWTPDGPEYTLADGETVRGKLTQWFPTCRWAAVPGAWADKNVYFGFHPCTKIPPTFANGKPAKPNQVRGRNEFVAAVNAVFAEFDVKDFGSKEAIRSHLDALPLYPTCVVDSGGGLHCYWFIEDTQAVTDASRSRYKALQAAWVDLVGGDDGAKDLARVLRLPGFQNRKPQYAPEYPTVQVVEYEWRRVFPFYRIAELVDDRIAEVERAERLRAEIDAARTADVASGAAEELLAWCIDHAGEGSRHSMALWLAGKLKAEGIARWVAHSVLCEFARRVSTPGTRQLADAEMSEVAAFVWGRI